MPAMGSTTSPSLSRQGSFSGQSRKSNVFDDGYAIDNVSSVLIDTSDAQSSRSRPYSRTSASYDTDGDSIAEHFADGSILPITSPFDVRSSMRKSRTYLVDPFRSDDDRGSGSSNHHSGTASDARSITGSTMSTTDSDLYSREPRRLYDRPNQHAALSRSSTITSTLSRHPPGRQSLHGPAHAYNMYPQNVEVDIVDEAASHSAPNESIPLGFPSRLNTSRFRNDADNLSEQLPPYSEYPEGGVPKPVDPRTGRSESAAASNPFADPRDPQSMSDAVHARASSDSQRDLPTSADRPWKQKSWKEKRRTKFCGIPFGWIVLVSGVLLFIVTVCSATIGGFFSAQAKDRESWYSNSQRLVDATPISVSMPPLPTGNFQLQLGSEQEAEAQCLTDQTQASSWNCSIFARGAMAINIQNTAEGKQVAYIYNANPPVTGYGTEVPQTFPATLKLVKDFDALQWGPAWQFQAVYTKIVHVPDVLLPHAPAASSKSKLKRHGRIPNRDDDESTNLDSLRQRQWSVSYAKPGEQFWKCSWNNTLIEGFIYMRNNSTSWYTTPKTSSSSSISSSSATSTSSSAPTSTSLGAATTTNSSCYWLNGAFYGNATSSTDPCPPLRGNDTWSQLPFFPEVVKVEERRLAGDPSHPYCEKKQLLNDGRVGDVTDPVSNQPIVIELSEQSPDMSSQTNPYAGASKKLKRDDKPLPYGSCHCQWVSGDYHPT